jgi:queuine tRNA-ribosyltransferase
MFDCVHPTRIARHATVFSKTGRISLLNAKWQTDESPIDATCSCYACKTFSKGYMRHLFKAKEILGLRMASLHNITFMINLMDEIRKSLLEKRFNAFKNEFFRSYFSKEDKSGS